MQTKHYLQILTMIAIGIFYSSASFAQSPKTVTLQSTAVEKSRGTNRNIKVDVPTTDVPVAKSRGGGCRYKFDNYTGLFIKVYVDGYYKGTIDPWGTASMTVNSAYTKVYMISAGGTREWSSSGECSSLYTYTLR